MNKRTDYKRLGDYIRQVDVRNKDLKVERLLGVSVSKEFMPSIANTIGTNMSTYKIVHEGQFVYIADTSRRGDKIAIALLKGKDAIVSSIYTVFEVIDNDQLCSEYLMMWFRRPEFDRYARFHSHGSAREIFDWDEMCDVMLPVPPIDRQREIVAQYEALTRRIRINEQMITKLEDTAQALYRKMFVDGIDKDNLPEGWRMGTVGEFCKEMKSGGTPSRTQQEYWDKKEIPWLKSGEVHNNIVLDAEDYISLKGLDNSSAKMIPSGSVVMAMYGATAAQVAYLACCTTTNQACCNMTCYSENDAAYLYFHLLFNQEEIKRLANGGAQENLSKEIIAAQQIYMHNDESQKTPFVVFIKELTNMYRENKLLTELQSLLLAKMGQ